MSVNKKITVNHFGVHYKCNLTFLRIMSSVMSVSQSKSRLFISVSHLLTSACRPIQRSALLTNLGLRGFHLSVYIFSVNMADNLMDSFLVITFMTSDVVENLYQVIGLALPISSRVCLLMVRR